MTELTVEQKLLYRKNMTLAAWMSLVTGIILLVTGLVLMGIGIVTINNAPTIEGSSYFVAEIITPAKDAGDDTATYVSLEKDTEGLEVNALPEEGKNTVGDRRAFYLLEDGNVLPSSEWSTIQLWIGLGFGLSIFLYFFAAMFLAGGFILKNKAKKIQ